MTPDWTTLATPADWEGALRALLAEADGALRAGNAVARDRVKVDLIAFVDESPNAIAGKLDSLALEAVKALSKAGIEGAIADIESRSADLARLTAALDRASGDNAAAASSIRLEWARKSVDSITCAVEALDGLRGSLREGNVDENLATRVEGLLAALKEVRKTIGEG